MSLATDDSTPHILKTLGLFLAAAYALFYLLCTIMYFAFGEPQELGIPSLPFETEHFGFVSSASRAAFWGQTAAFVLLPGLAYFIVRSTKNTWDYMLTFGVIHVCAASVVGGGLPGSGTWWIAFVASVAYATIVGELACYLLRDLREIKLER